MGLTASTPLFAQAPVPVTGPEAPVSTPTALPLTPEEIEQIKRADQIEEAKKALKEHTDKLNVDIGNNNKMEILNDKNRIQQYQNIINSNNVPSPSLSTTSMTPAPVR
jgi:hypothetical protein